MLYRAVLHARPVLSGGLLVARRRSAGRQVEQDRGVRHGACPMDNTGEQLTGLLLARTRGTLLDARLAGRHNATQLRISTRSIGRRTFATKGGDG